MVSLSRSSSYSFFFFPLRTAAKSGDVGGDHFGISFDVMINPTAVQPLVTMAPAEKADRKSADTTKSSHDSAAFVIRQVSRMTYLRRPPALRSDFSPNDFAVSRFFADDALIAEPVGIAVRFDGQGQAFLVKGGRTRVATEQVAAVGTGEAKADVDVR